jgi:hypothetical protein
MPSSKSNRNFIIGFAILAAVSLTFGLLNYKKAFTEIGIDFKVTKKEALTNAREFLTGRGFDLTGYREIATFGGDFGAKLYMEREVGVERMNQLIGDSVDVWGWRNRFFKPLQKLEYRVGIDPKGRLITFSRQLEESAEGPSLDTLAARALVEAFVTGPMSVDLSKWRLIESSYTDRPKRRDHKFTYEMNEFKVKDAPYRMTVELQGAEISSFRRFLRISEDWWREWEKQRAENEMFQNIAEALSLLTIAAAFFYFFRHVKKAVIPWKTAFAFGGVLAVAQFIMGINTIPLALAWESTTSSFATFLAQEIIQSLVQGLTLGLLLVLLIGAGEFLYRSDYPDKLALTNILTRRGMRSREFFEATIMGYLLCAFFIGYVVFYYIIGNKLGFWSPAEIKYDESVSTLLPWIYPLAISFYAAMTEEFWFRLFGIGLFKRLTKSTWLAILIPAVIWAFLHSNYPQQPGFARGVEITIVGIIAGYVMIRFGIWACLVYHYVFDAILIGLFLFRSQNLYFWTSGLIVCGFLLVPGAVAGIAYWRRRKFEPVDDLSNDAFTQAMPAKETAIHPTVSSPAIEPLPVESVVQSSLRPFTRRLGIVVGVVGLVLALIPGPREFGDNVEVKIDREQALTQANTLLTARYGVAPDSFKVGVEASGMSAAKFSNILKSQQSQDYSASYLKRHTTLDEAERLLLTDEGRGSDNWWISYKRVLDPVEYHASIPMSGSPGYIIRRVADSTFGADLSEDQAAAMAAELFAASEPNASEYHQIEKHSFKRPNRRDWDFVYETKEPVVKEAYFRRTIDITGDDAISFNRWIKVPEEWRRAEQEKPVLGTIFLGVTVIGLIVLLIVLVKSLGSVMKKGEVDWKSARRVAYLVAGAVIVLSVLNLTNYWSDYNTSKPASNHLGFWLVDLLSSLGWLFGFTLLATALAESFVKSSGTGNRTVLSIFRLNDWNRDDVIAALAMAGGIIGVSVFTKWLGFLLGNPIHSYSYQLPEGIGSCSPFLSAILSPIGSDILVAVVVVACFYLLQGILKSTSREILFLLLFSVAIVGTRLSQSGNWTNPEIAWAFIQVLLKTSMVYYGVKFWGVGRIHAVVMAVLFTSLLTSGADFIGLQNPTFAWNGWIVLAVAGVVAVLLGIRALKEDPAEGGR